MTTHENNASLLLCIYYRVAAADAESVISTVREFQRTLRSDVRLSDVQVLLRCGLPNAAASPDSVSDRPIAPAAALPASAPPASAFPTAEADATLMETYRLALPAAYPTGASDAIVRAFLERLEAAARPISALLRGERHVELFAPCAS